MAEAGRFMTKCETVGGMGSVSLWRTGRGRGVEVVVESPPPLGLGLDLDLGADSLRVTTACSPFWEAARTASTAERMKVRPSSQKGRTKGVT